MPKQIFDEFWKKTKTRWITKWFTAPAIIVFLMGWSACGPSNNTGTEEDSGIAQDSDLPDATLPVDAFVDPNIDKDEDGYTPAQGDCDDNDPEVYPGAPIVCGDGKDNNCNGFIDDAEPDQDGDGYPPCRNGEVYDCDDDDPNIHPGMNEIPGDGIDNNCDGIIDGDYDGDGWTEQDGDCDDFDPDIYPGAPINCYDGKDNNCNGFTDEEEPDMDGDGYGPCDGDCDDTDPNIGPHMSEIPGDGIDNNCDGLTDEDIDGDGWTVANGDCDDSDPNRHPAAIEICDDGIDNNCNGITDDDCLDPCVIAQLTRSNVGCEYIAVDMDNYPGLADTACYAIIISNTHETETANVEINRWVGGTPQPMDFPGHGTSRSIPPGELQVFRVSGNCSAPGSAVSGDLGIHGTGISERGAVQIVSDLPVVAYQINPYEAANIHTTDASLLIPTPALDDTYYAVTYPQTNPSRGSWDLPSAVNIVPVEDNTQVTFTSSTNTRAGGGIPALSAGETHVFTLNAFDNLQIETQTTGHDLSGSYIQADKPIGVWAGAQCADIPINSGYCDHLEQQLTPLSTWGTQYAAAMHPQRNNEQVLWRFVAAEDNTTITFDPAVHPDLTLDAGEVYEFGVTQDFLATSTNPDKPFFVVQFMVGAVACGATGNLRGDPAMTLSVPTAQYLDRYVFLSDPTYAYNWLVVVRTSSSDTIYLDCFNPIPDDRFQTIGAGPYQVARITLSAESGGVDGSCTSGAHFIEGDGPFGIWVYGVFADTSYGYPGGMNLERIYTIN